MKTQAVIFLGKSRHAQPLKTHLEIVAAQDLEKLKEQDLPVAYVLPSQHLSYLRGFGNLIIERGTKQKAKALTPRLLGCDRIPIIYGEYSDPGQLRRSVRTLLANALKRGERNVYFIGVAEPLFETLWKQAVEREAAGNGISGAGRRKAKFRSVASPGDGSISARELLRILGEEPEPEGLAERYVGESDETRLVRQLIIRAARSDCRVFLLGPTGTGKEIIARAIHDYSRRKDWSFFAMNCAAIPASLLEAELFGTEREIATGVRERKGVWLLAHNGTLFLDEIGDLPLEAQAKILRALEENTIRPVGLEKEGIRVDVRVIAATNRDLYSMVRSGQFREDLYYRLAEFKIRTPDLKDHPRDIPALVQHHWKKITQNRKGPHKTLGKAIESELQSLRWQGNVRELKAVLVSLDSLCWGKSPEVQDLQTVFLLDNYVRAERRERPARRGARPRPIEWLRHLQRVEGVVGDWKVTINSFLKQQRTERKTSATIQDRLRFGLGELEALCVQPRLFHSEATYSAVHQFQGKLSYFQDLLEQDRKEAFNYLKKDLVEGVSHALAQVGKEIEVLRASTS